MIHLFIANNAQHGMLKTSSRAADENLPLLSAAAIQEQEDSWRCDLLYRYPQRSIGRRNVTRPLPLRQCYCLLKVTGAQIKEWLEMSAGQFNQKLIQQLKDTTTH